MPRATPEPTTAAAPAALPSLPPFPSIAEVGKRTVAISARYDALEEASLRLPDRLPSVVAEKTAMAQIDAERDALTELVCARCADSLEDAAVQAAFGFQIVDRTLACELEPTARDGTLEADLETLRSLFASIIVAIARAADINADRLGWGDLGRCLRLYVPAVETQS